MDEVENELDIVDSEKSAVLPVDSEQYRTTQLLFREENGKTVTKLRRPRDLYALSKSTFQTVPRWPSELKIVSRPLHILYTPASPEPLAVKDLKSLERKTNKDLLPGQIVYDNSPDPQFTYFTSAKSESLSMSKSTQSYRKTTDHDNLIFESRFESGNLMRATKVGAYDYQLWLNFDMYTKKHTQWYYFRVQNTRSGVSYTFTIMNFIKNGSLYNEGLKPLFYSQKDCDTNNVGWRRIGDDISYYKNDVGVEGSKDRHYYSLQWSCVFPQANDVCYFAHSYPYTYSDLQSYLAYLTTDGKRKETVKQRVLCETLAGNHVYVLTITSPTISLAKMKKVIVVSARVHPGESVSSWMMKGFLDFLTSDQHDAQILRDTFVFKVIPMLNPDGVIVGNYRCSLSGRDLNRNYRTLLKDSFPPVWSTSYLVKRLKEERDVAFYCDFHGHSRKKNIFIYGCDAKEYKGVARVFPMMLSKNVPDKFSYSSCRFYMQKNKEGTGRMVMWNHGITNSFTLEASFCGSSLMNERYHFSVQDYEEMGYHFCDTLLDFFDPDCTKFDMLLSDIQEQSLREETTQVDSGGSDSSVSDGLPMQLLLDPKAQQAMAKKKNLKTRKERNQKRKKVKKNNNSSDKMITNTSTESVRQRKPKKRTSKKNLLVYSKTADESSNMYERFFHKANYFPKESIATQEKECKHHYHCNETPVVTDYTINPAPTFDVKMTKKRNATLELAERIAAYNLIAGRPPVRLNRVNGMWNDDRLRKDEIMKSRNEVENMDSLHEKIDSITLHRCESSSSACISSATERSSLARRVTSTARRVPLEQPAVRRLNKLSISPPKVSREVIARNRLPSLRSVRVEGCSSTDLLHKYPLLQQEKISIDVKSYKR